MSEIPNARCLPPLVLYEHEMVPENNFREFAIDCMD